MCHSPLLQQHFGLQLQHDPCAAGLKQPSAWMVLQCARSQIPIQTRAEHPGSRPEQEGGLLTPACSRVWSAVRYLVW